MEKVAVKIGKYSTIRTTFSGELTLYWTGLLPLAIDFCIVVNPKTAGVIMNNLSFLFLLFIIPGFEASAQTDNPDSTASVLLIEGNYWKLIDISKQYGIDSMSARFQYAVGMSYAALSELQRAQELLKKAIARDSAVLQYRYQYGRILTQSGQYDEAVAQLSACAAMDSNYIPARFQLGLTYAAQKNKPEQELDIFSSLIERNQNDFLSLYYKADAFKRMGMEDSSSIYLQLSLTVNPRYYPALIALSNYLSRKNRFNDALRYYLRAESIRSDNKDLLFQIGECCRKMGDLPRAKRYFAHAIALDSMNALYHAQLAYTHFTAGEFDSSAAEYQQAVLYDEENVQFRLNLALVYKKLDLTEMVIRTYIEAIRVMHAENISFVYNDLAAFYMSKGMNREAIRAYERVVDINPGNTEAYFFIALAYESLSDKRNAVRNYAEYVKRLPNDSTTLSTRSSVKKKIEELKKMK